MSDELISRKGAIFALGERPISWTDSDYELGLQHQYDIDRARLEHVPALIRIPLLTCKDCEYWETDWSCDGAWHYCPMADEIHGPNFYCGYAEPRKDEGR